MTDSRQKSPQLYGLLIGIDHYPPNQLPDGSSYQNLKGCVRDINQVEAFLQHKLKLPSDNILKLTASQDTFNNPIEPPEQLPTYENIVAKFQQLANIAQQGDSVYIHYSGHGGRATTLYPEVKGKDGIDEALVPTNIGNPNTRYIRDIELAFLLENLVNRQLIVTLVLDCCHSGGATRGNQTEIRGINAIDTTIRSSESLVASREELITAWQKLSPTPTRNLAVNGGMLPDAKGYVLLAACRPSESAYEYTFEENKRNGVLTYWLLKFLDHPNPELTYKVLYDYLLAKINSQFSKQTPMLFGEGTRLVFGYEKRPIHQAVTIMEVKEEQQQIKINGGQVHGLVQGSQLAVYPSGTDFTNIEKRLAIADITSLGATSSWAIIKPLSEQPQQLRQITQGDQAVLLNPNSISLVRKVSLLFLESYHFSSINFKPFLETINQKIAETNWLDLVLQNENAHYQIVINQSGEYEIWDSGTERINLRPVLKFNDHNATTTLINRLIHLAKYQGIYELNNYDSLNPLKKALQVDLFEIPPDFQAGIRPDLHNPCDMLNIKVNEQFIVRIKNNSSKRLNVTLLVLQPDWSISQIYPSDEVSSFEEFEPGQEDIITLQTSLPEGFKQGVDIIKAFATIDPTNFRWLELPCLDQPHLSKQLRNLEEAKNPLEVLLTTISENGSSIRNLKPANYPSQKWITTQKKVTVIRD